jgi:hypothetical protein
MKFSDSFYGILLILLVSLSCFDAFASLLWVSHNFASEANPLMAALMEIDFNLFLFIKLGVTALCGIIFWKIRHRALAKWALFLSLIVYIYVFYKHMGILYEVICFHQTINQLING